MDLRKIQDKETAIATLKMLLAENESLNNKIVKALDHCIDNEILEPNDCAEFLYHLATDPSNIVKEIKSA